MLSRLEDDGKLKDAITPLVLGKKGPPKRGQVHPHHKEALTSTPTPPLWTNINVGKIGVTAKAMNPVGFDVANNKGWANANHVEVTRSASDVLRIAGCAFDDYVTAGRTEP